VSRRRTIGAGRPGLLALALLAGLAGLAAGCGKKAALRAPDGEESRYSYPGTYPKPATVVPLEAGQSAPLPEEEGEQEEDRLSPFPDERRRTTYDGS
jgi:hypothetical protein